MIETTASLKAAPAESQALIVTGGARIIGRARASGSKNASFPILAAALLTENCSIAGLSAATDVQLMLRMIETLGANVDRSSHGRIRVNTRQGLNGTVPPELGAAIRGSYYVLGPLLARLGAATLPLPGGDDVGMRPMDLHIAALELMGASITVSERQLVAAANGLHGACIRLPFPSRGATGNVMLAASLASGETTIEHANQSPEIKALGAALLVLGAKIRGLGTEIISIEGRPSLQSGGELVVPTDRIEVGTLILAGLATGGEVVVDGVELGDMCDFIAHLRIMGVAAESDSATQLLSARATKSVRGAHVDSGLPPKLDPDYEPLLAAFLCRLEGDHRIHDPSNPERHARYLPELHKLGANIEQVTPDRAIVHGVPRLCSSRDLIAREIRGAASLLLAACAAEGVSVIRGTTHLDRGYERLDDKLRGLGANVTRVVAGHHL